jgi:hypothetical protein
MADLTPYPDSDSDAGRGGESTTGTPRWVKVFGVIALVVVVLFVVVTLIRGGEHGPSRHTPGGGSDTTSATVADHTGPPPGITHEQQP